MNSKNKSSERSNNDLNNKNKTVPGFNNNMNNNDLNQNNKEFKMNPNVKKLIIHRTKNMKNINY